MKRFLLYLLTIAAFVACSKGEDEDSGNSEPTPEKPKTEIKIETSTSDFTTEGGDNTISFTTNEAWTAQVINSRADDWCKINPTSGSAGNATITVTTTPNDTPDDRTASIIIKAGAVSKTVTVSQKQKDALTITASKFEVAAAGGEVAIEVKANIDFEYVIDDDAKEWISYEGTRALKTSKLAFKIAENDDIEKREGQIAIKSGEFNEVVTIYQAGDEPTIVISKNEYVVSSDGETVAVEVTSNVDVAVEMPVDVDWISESTTRATSTNTYYFDIQPNENYDQRTAEIKFTNKENGLSETVKVVQTQKDALVVAKDSYTVSSDGDQIEIEVGHNVDFDIEIANDWITKTQNTRAFVTENIVFNIAKNPTYDNREGTIIFKSKDGKLTQTVKVYQAQEDALIISKKDIVVSDEGGTISFELQTNVEFKVSEPDVDWLRPVVTRGLTTHTLHYEYDANSSYDSREAHIVVTNTKTNASETITITQTQKDAIVLAKDSYTVDSEGGQLQIEVGHNVDFDIEISNDWITKTENTRAFVTETLNFNIAKNPTTDNREGTIIFKSKDGKLTQTVKVYQAQEDALIISKKDIVVSDEGGTISFELQTNVDFKVSDPDVDWLRPVTTRGLTTHTLNYTVDANTSYDSREAHIIVTDTKNNKSEIITITQTQKDAIVLAKDSYTVSSEGDQIEIEIGHNVDFDIEIANDWITKVDTRAFVTETLVFNIAKHTGYDNREGTIVFKSKDGKLSQTVKVYQAQEDALIISKKDIVVSDEGGTISFELQTNVEFKVSDPNVDWLRAITTRGLATHTLSYTVDANTSYDSREAKIVVTDTKNNKSETITITQAQKDAIVLAKSEYEFSVDGGNLDFEIQTNVDITVTISDNAKDWIQQVETRALETKALYFNVAACSAEEDREGTITISGGNATQTITVKQSGLKEILEKEREALIAFYNATGGDNWTNNTNWCSDKPVSEWYGIRTDNLGYICDISLWENNLIGEIPIRLCELAKLKYLDLSANMLSGCIPDDIGRLSQLESLILQNNKLKGSIPKSIGELKNLTNLSIGENNLEGSIPPEIGNLSELKHISAFSNMLSGSIPEELCQLVKLESVFIRSTMLSGPIPANIGNLKNLKYLNLCQNSLSGKVPESIIQLENLEELTLVENKSLDIDLPQSTFLDTHWGQMLPENTYDLKKLHINFNSFNMIDLNGNQLDSETIFSSNKYTLMYHYSTTRMYEDINDINRLKQLYSDCSEEGFEIIGYVNGEYNGINVPQLKDVEMFISENDIPWSNVFMTKDNCMNVKYVFYPYIAPTFTIVDSTGRVVFFDYAKFDTEIRSVVKSVVGFVKRQFNKDQDIYKSTDYSQDGIVTTLQTATKGNGIDIVLMGDAYSDRQIADGTYKSAMENIYNNLFTEEPYKSFKDHFNVYYVNVVSLNEGYEYEYGNTALEGFFGEGTLVGGNNNAVFTYTLNAIPSDKMDNALLVVAMNSDNYAGTCYMFNSVGNGDYGSGVSVAYFPRGGNAETFAQLLHHEACGHGFAKLADEYAYEGMGTIPEAAVNDHKAQQTNWGWWKNVDFTSDPTATRWSHFVNDTRYANEGLGAYEGGLTYWTGVWRPTENSIMRYNTGGFNAPSREAIYYRIHKLAYGEDWQYDYEKFVEWDAKNRKTAAATRGVPYKSTSYKPTHPPVVINKSWRDAK